MSTFALILILVATYIAIVWICAPSKRCPNPMPPAPAQKQPDNIPYIIVS